MQSRIHSSRVLSLPERFDSVEALEEFMSRPNTALRDELVRVSGDIMVLGVGGKMGPTLARLAKRAAPAKRVIGVARFSEAGLREKLESWGIECIGCDLLEPAAVAALPKTENIIFMAGHKFGSASNPTLTWAINVGVPHTVADVFRHSRIVAFSTACVYPYADTAGPGANEQVPAEPPAGAYTNSCVGREHMFLHGSHQHGTAGRLVRLSYAIDTRYGVLYDIATSVYNEERLGVSMGYVNVIWQGDANEQALRLLGHCTAPTSPINVSGANKTSVRWLAEEFGKRFGRAPRLQGQESDAAWLVDTTQAQTLFGQPKIPIVTMIDWVAHWVRDGHSGLGKKTHFETRDGKY